MQAALHVCAATVASETSMTMLGFGGSGACSAQSAVLSLAPGGRTTCINSLTTSARISNLLFSDYGMGLTSYRYNVGGGGVNVSNPVRAPETFYVSNGTYDWDADASGRYFALLPITMFVNSAPAAMTLEHASCGSSFANGTGDWYGGYVADVLEHFLVDEGLSKISYISPMNEPDNNFGPSPCGQEGLETRGDDHWSVQRLVDRGLEAKIGILADESSSLSRAKSEYADWLPEVIDMVAHLVHHTYDFPTDESYSSYAADVAERFPEKTTWMSEVCCSLGEANGNGRGWSGGYDPTIANALMWSGMVYQCILVAGEAHYDFWTLVSNGIGCDPLDDPTCTTTANADDCSLRAHDLQDGVIYYDDDYATNGNYELYLTKHFWAYKHFGNFVKPGSPLYPITNFESAMTNKGVFVLISKPLGSVRG
ncbi:glycoside hydrolase superfamily [Schizophyllum amplum]|uniref:Glycoside hydrolase superfamily n=1 Tax=Schizophyllum amplum TaxID=97359 RepID=A0A550BTM9_9AGAR|nr:glycoside hydrolase superfamily [Auriculariopsis ampla]